MSLSERQERRRKIAERLQLLAVVFALAALVMGVVVFVRFYFPGAGQ